MVCTAYTPNQTIISTTREFGKNEAGTVYDFKDKYLKEQLALYKEKHIKFSFSRQIA